MAMMARGGAAEPVAGAVRAAPCATMPKAPATPRTAKPRAATPSKATKAAAPAKSKAKAAAKAAPAKAPAKPRKAAPSLPVPAEDVARAVQAATLLADKGCEHIRILALPPGSAVADVVVLGTARSDRQMRAAVEDVRQWAKDTGIAPRGVEGETGWMLIDCYSVVVHAFLAEERERYQLDSLWPEARDLGLDGTPLAGAVPMPAEPAAPRLRKARVPAALPAPKVRPVKGRPAKGSRAPKDS
jgi:ribosome-associated protein